MKRRYIQLFGKWREINATRGFIGEIRWDRRGYLVVATRRREVGRGIETMIRSRIAAGQYYIAAAVRTGAKPSGLRFDRIDDRVPEVLRCIAADRELWKRHHAGYRITPVYQDGA